MSERLLIVLFVSQLVFILMSLTVMVLAVRLDGDELYRLFRLLFYLPSQIIRLARDVLNIEYLANLARRIAEEILAAISNPRGPHR